MRLKWDEQGIRWFLDASAYTGYHEKLAGYIVPHLKPGDTLCDAGCGLGRLDLELAPYVSRVTAVDINENAIGVLRQDVAARGLDNVCADVGDAGAMTETFDVVLMSFFGRFNMREFLKLFRRKLIRIVGADNSSNLHPERYGFIQRDTVPSVCEELDSIGASYSLEQYSIEFGQPLRSREDAELYVLGNAPEAPLPEVRDFLEERLERTGRDDFPLYLPNMKNLGIFIIEKEQ